MFYSGYIILLALPNDFVIFATVKLHGYMNLFSRIFLLLAVGLISTASVLAQGEANVWYFGENGGLIKVISESKYSKVFFFDEMSKGNYFWNPSVSLSVGYSPGNSLACKCLTLQRAPMKGF